MREIKFRAWDKESKIMINGFALDTQGNILFTKKRSPDGKYRFSDCKEQGYGNDRFEIMQFTGLHDRNGKEIYEGDIIEKEVQSRPHSSNARSCKARYEVKFHKQKSQDNEHNNKILMEDPSAFNSLPCFYGKEIYNERGYRYQSWSEFACCEIIGNIYENPELLK